MKTRKILAIAALSTLTFAGFAPTAHAQSSTRPIVGKHFKQKKERHPQIKKAMKALNNAKTALQRADRDFDGHRSKAVQAIDAALAECRAALKADKH